MKFKCTKQDLIERWRKKAESKNALAKSYPLTKGGKKKHDALIHEMAAYIYELCANELEMWDEEID